MIYYSGLYRQGMSLVDQGFAYTARSTSAEKSMEILTWLVSEKPSIPGLACQYIIILLNKTVLWHQVSQKVQMTPNFSTSSPTYFFFLCSVDQKHIIKHNEPNSMLPSLLLLSPQAEEACGLHILERKDGSIGRTNNTVNPSGLFFLFLPKVPVLKWNGAYSRISLGKILLLSLDFYWHAGKLVSLL